MITNEQKLKISAALKGRKKGPMSEEIKRKISLAKMGTPSWNKGIAWSLEMRKKLSIAHQGQKNPMKGKKNPNIIGEKHPMWGKSNVAAIGAKNNNWKGGITSLYIKIRNCKRSIIWRNEVFERDNYTCQECGKRGGRLNADHIKEFSLIISENKITSLEEAYKCEELWDINNGGTLCNTPCHKNKTAKFLLFNWRNQYATA